MLVFVAVPSWLLDESVLMHTGFGSRGALPRFAHDTEMLR